MERKVLSVEELPWSELNQLGFTKASLEKTDNLENLCHFRKTSLLHVSGSVANVNIKGQAKLSVSIIGEATTINLQFKKNKPDLNYPIYGVYLNESQKNNLLDTGHAGSPIKVRRKDGEIVDLLVSIDPDTNQLECLSLKSVNIPEKAFGIEFSEEQREKLKHGEYIFLESLQTKEGKVYNACIQFSADKRKLVFVKPESYKDRLALSKAHQEGKKKSQFQGL